MVIKIIERYLDKTVNRNLGYSPQLVFEYIAIIGKKVKVEVEIETVKKRLVENGINELSKMNNNRIMEFVYKKK